jgi:hypothetical protein
MLELLKFNSHPCTHLLRSCCSPVIQLTNLFAKGGLKLKIRANLLCPQSPNLPLTLFLLMPHLRHLHAFQNGPDHEEANNTHGNMKTMQKPLVIDGTFQCTKCPMHHLLQQCHPRAMALFHIFLIQAASCLLDIHTEILRVTWKTQQHVVCTDGFSVMAVECNQLLVRVINLMCKALNKFLL